MRPIKKHQSGFTLVELMIVVAIVGILAALAIYGVRKYMINAKTAEARNSLGQIAKDASAAFNREGMKADVLAQKGTATISNHLCITAANPVPLLIADIGGKKYQSSSAPLEDWQVGDKDTGWACLKFTMQEPQYFQYTYVSDTPADLSLPGTKFTAQAQGNLSGGPTDTKYSTFALLGAVQGGVVNIAPNISEVDPEE